MYRRDGRSLLPVCGAASGTAPGSLSGSCQPPLRPRLPVTSIEATDHERLAINIERPICIDGDCLQRNDRAVVGRKNLPRTQWPQVKIAEVIDHPPASRPQEAGL